MLRFVTAAAAAFSITAAAFAHASLKSSSIEDGATLEAAPGEITLEFTVEVGLAAIRLETAEGQRLEAGFTPQREMSAVHIAPLPELGAGSYVFEWRALASDGHVMTGEIGFSVTGGDD